MEKHYIAQKAREKEKYLWQAGFGRAAVRSQGTKLRNMWTRLRP